MDIQLAFQNADVLRAIVAHGGLSSTADLARLTGKDKSNLHKTIGRLVDGEALYRDQGGALQVCGPALAVIAAADIAEGKSPPPPQGFASAFHAQIHPDALNPRLDLDSEEFKESLDELRQDILQNGLLQNLVVRPYGDICGWNIELEGRKLPLYRLVSGERRWRAIGQAIADGDWDALQPLPIQIIDTDDHGHRLRALAENLQRRALSPLEEAKAFQGLVDDGMDTQQIADAVSMSRRNVQLRLQLLELSTTDQARLELPKEDDNHLTIREAKKKLQKPKAPPEPQAWDPAHLLLAAEIQHKLANDPGPGYARTEIDPETPDSVLNIFPVSWASIDRADYNTGRTYVRFHFHGSTIFEGQLRIRERELDEAFLADLRCEVLGDAEAAAINGAGVYYTDWLNGPFELTDEGRAIVEARAAEKAQADADAAEKKRERDEEADRSRRMVIAAVQMANEVGATYRPALAPALEGLLAENKCPLPWSVNDDGDLVDANNEMLVGTPNALAARRLIIAMAVNALAGMPVDANRVRLVEAPVAAGADDDQ